MKRITHEMALRALNEAVKAKGYNYVYPRSERGNYCFNVWHGKPDCIVGHALISLGVPIEWFKDERVNDGAYDVCNLLAFEEMFMVDEDAVNLFRNVQDSQDSHVPWGEAVTRAHLGEAWFGALRLHLDRA